MKTSSSILIGILLPLVTDAFLHGKGTPKLPPSGPFQASTLPIIFKTGTPSGKVIQDTSQTLEFPVSGMLLCSYNYHPVNYTAYIEGVQIKGPSTLTISIGIGGHNTNFLQLQVKGSGSVQIFSKMWADKRKGAVPKSNTWKYTCNAAMKKE